MTQCASCGANLVPDGDPNVPGLTAVDAASIIRSKSPQQPRSRLLSWLSGEYATDLPSKAEQQAIAPPDLDVRREILQLELGPKSPTSRPKPMPCGRRRRPRAIRRGARRRLAAANSAAEREPTADAEPPTTDGSTVAEAPGTDENSESDKPAAG
jgi:hypothetical protein